MSRALPLVGPSPYVFWSFLVWTMKTVLLSACSEGARESDKMLKVQVSTKGERGAVWGGL